VLPLLLGGFWTKLHVKVKGILLEKMVIEGYVGEN
jgi:hypothetical protein